MERFGTPKNKAERPRHNELVVADVIHHEAQEAIVHGRVPTSGEPYLIHSSHNETTISVSTSKDRMIPLETIERDGITYYVGIPKP